MKTKHAQIEYDDWFYKEPEEIPYFQSENISYSTPETRAIGAWVVEDPRYNTSMAKWVRKRFQKTYDIETVHEELITRFMNDLIGGAEKLKQPYAELTLYSLQNVDWDQLADFYTNQLTGTEAAPQTQLEKAIEMFPDEQDLLPESDYDLIEEEKKKVPMRTRPNIRYEEQHPQFQPTYT
jgi:hypothetical protein